MSKPKTLSQQVADLNARFSEASSELADLKKYAPLVKAQYQAEAEARDAVLQSKHLAKLVEGLQRQVADCSVQRAYDTAERLRAGFWRAEETVNTFAGRVEALEKQAEGAETACKRLTREVEGLQTVKGYNPVFIHSGSCFKAGDDVRESCPECQPEPAQSITEQIYTDAKLHNQQLAWIDMAEEVYDYVSRQVASFEGEDEPSEREGKNLLVRLAYVVQPKVAKLAGWHHELLTQYLSDHLSGSTWSRDKFPGVTLEDVMDEITRRTTGDQ